VSLLGEVGFEGAEIRERFDPFLWTSKERVARKYGVVGVNVRGRRPDRDGRETGVQRGGR
jgi:hypothetical protein